MYYDLANDLDHYLGTVLAGARQRDDDAVAELGRAEIPHLVRTVRTLLDQHQPDNRHRCPSCRGRRWMFWRRPNVPCRAYLAAHRRLLVLADRVSDAETSRPRMPVITPDASPSHPAHTAAVSVQAAPATSSPGRAAAPPARTPAAPTAVPTPMSRPASMTGPMPTPYPSPADAAAPQQAIPAQAVTTPQTAAPAAAPQGAPARPGGRCVDDGYPHVGRIERIGEPVRVPQPSAGH